MSDRVNVGVWVTRYALTRGVQHMRGSLVRVEGQVYFSKGHLFLNSTDWFHEKSDAIKRAEEMRKRKLDSLRQQITRLESLEFT